MLSWIYPLWSSSREYLVWVRNTPWMGHRIHTYGKFIPASPPTGMFSGGGWRAENPDETHVDTGRASKLYTDSIMSSGSKPRTLKLWCGNSTHCTTMPSDFFQVIKMFHSNLRQFNYTYVFCAEKLKVMNYETLSAICHKDERWNRWIINLSVQFA